MFKELRTNWELQKNELASKMLVTRKEISDAENGKEISTELIQKYSAFFGVDSNLLIEKTITYDEVTKEENDKIALNGVSMNKNALYTGFADSGIKYTSSLILGSILIFIVIQIVLLVIFGFLNKPLELNLSVAVSALMASLIFITLLLSIFGFYYLFVNGFKYKGHPISTSKNATFGINVKDKTIYFRNFNGCVKKYSFDQLKYVQKVQYSKFKRKIWAPNTDIDESFYVIEVKFNDQMIAYFDYYTNSIYDKLSEALYINSHAERKWSQIIEEKRQERTQEFIANTRQIRKD